MSSQLQDVSTSVHVNRRQFLGSLSGLVLAASLSGVAKAQDARKYGADAMPHGTVDDPLTFVAIIGCCARAAWHACRMFEWSSLFPLPDVFR